MTTSRKLMSFQCRIIHYLETQNEFVTFEQIKQYYKDLPPAFVMHALKGLSKIGRIKLNAKGVFPVKPPDPLTKIEIKQTEKEVDEFMKKGINFLGLHDMINHDKSSK